MPIEVVRDDWTDPDDPGPRTQLYRDLSRSVITRNRSPDLGFETSLNPYRGCEHGCVYCASGETAVLMADGRALPLAELRVGDEIYGSLRRARHRRYVRTRVLAHWEVQRPAYRITLEDGTALVAGGDHRFLTLRGWKFVTGADQGRYRRPHLTPNDKLLGTGGFASRPSTASADYRRGYLCGWIRGDGLLASDSYSGRRRLRDEQHQFRLALADVEALERAAGYLNKLGIETRPLVFQESSANRRILRGIRTHALRHVQLIEEIIAWPASASLDWSRGYLAGIFDAEGSFSGGVLRISNTNSAIVRETTRALHRLGFSSVVENVVRGRTRPIQVIRVRGGLRQHLRFFHSIEPAIGRKRNIEGLALKSAAALRVVSIEPVGSMTLFDLTTGTGDFIADGVVSHNCYARPTHEYFGLSAGLDFETKIFAKEEAPEWLRRELASPRWEPQVLVMSGVTDPYQPAERRLRITRRCLEVLAEFRNPVAVITKSYLVTRDLDVLSELARYGAASVTLSVTSLDPDLGRRLEPRAAAPALRLKAVARLAEAGIPVGVNVAPVIPGLTDHEIPRILEAAAEAGALTAGYIMLRLPYAVKELFEGWLDAHFPERKSKVLGRIRQVRGGRLNDPRFGSRMKGEGPYARHVARLFQVARRRAGLDRPRVHLSTAAFRRPARPGGQLPLFE